MYIVGLGGMLTIIQCMYFMNKYYMDVTITMDTLYYLFSRPLFMTFLFIMIFPSIIGKGKLLNYALGSAGFDIMSRFTYCGYLMHLCFMNHYVNSQRQGSTFDISNLLLLFWGYLALTMVVSIGLCVVFECPIIEMERMLLFAQKAVITPNEEELKILSNCLLYTSPSPRDS